MTATMQISVDGVLSAAPQTEQRRDRLLVVFHLVGAHRWFNRQTQSWVLGDLVHYRCVAWDALAVNIAKLSRGDGMLVTGQLEGVRIEDWGGKPTPVLDLRVDSAGHSLDDARLTAKPEADKQATPPSPGSEKGAEMSDNADPPAPADDQPTHFISGKRHLGIKRPVLKQP